MHDFSGADGELIQRLMAIIDNDPVGDEFWWLDVSGIVADALGGCADIVPESNRSSADGSVSWEHQGSREVVARVIWMNRIRLRLAALVGDGMAEDFLVTALRDHIETELGRSQVSPTGAVARTKYEEWIAEQAVGTENLELSLIARALMTPAPTVDLSAASSPRLQLWTTARDAIDSDAVAGWRAARAAVVGAQP